MSFCEESLIAAAVAGDRAALEKLLEYHFPSLCDRLKGAIGPAYRAVLDTDDALQITCMEAFLGIARFHRRGPDAFFGWLLRIAQNNLRDAIRSLDREKREPRKRQVRDPYGTDSYVGLLANLVGTGTTPSGHAAREEMMTVLKEAIGKLPELYQKVVKLIDLEGNSTDVVAKSLGRTPGAVHMARQRAHDHLSRLMGDSTRFFSGKCVKSVRS